MNLYNSIKVVFLFCDATGGRNAKMELKII